MPAKILWPSSLAQVFVSALARTGCEPRGAGILPQGSSHVREWWATPTTSASPSPLDIDSCFPLVFSRCPAITGLTHWQC
jgi:hypothetical protein